MIAEASRGHWSEPEIDFSTFPSREGRPLEYDGDVSAKG